MTENKDLEHIRLLSIFHYVVGGLIALFACFPIIHLVIGITFLTTDFPQQPGEPEFPTKLFGLMFTIIPLFFIFAGWTLAIFVIIAGRKLSDFKSYTFCFVVAAILCVFMPFGTILGVFTIIVLMRDSVKSLFNGQSFSPNDNQMNWK